MTAFLICFCVHLTEWAVLGLDESNSDECNYMYLTIYTQYNHPRQYPLPHTPHPITPPPPPPPSTYVGRPHPTHTHINYKYSVTFLLTSTFCIFHIKIFFSNEPVLWVRLSAYQSVCLSVYLPVCLSLSVSGSLLVIWMSSMSTLWAASVFKGCSLQ